MASAVLVSPFSIYDLNMAWTGSADMLILAHLDISDGADAFQTSDSRSKYGSMISSVVLSVFLFFLSQWVQSYWPPGHCAGEGMSAWSDGWRGLMFCQDSGCLYIPTDAYLRSSSSSQFIHFALLYAGLLGTAALVNPYTILLVLVLEIDLLSSSIHNYTFLIALHHLKEIKIILYIIHYLNNDIIKNIKTFYICNV